MIFRKFSRIRGIESVEFLIDAFNALVEDLNTGLSRLRLGDNFESNTFKDEVFEAGEIRRFTHNLGVIPSGRIIIRKSRGDVYETIFTDQYIEMVNAEAFSVVISFVIIK